MSTTFQWDAITWLRDEAGLATEVRPGDRISDPDAPMLVEGWQVRPSRAGAFGHASLWLLTVAVLLSMLGLPGMSESTEAMLNRVGQVGVGVAAVLGLVGWIVARRHRDPTIVQLHPSASPPTTEAIAALHRQAGGAAVWIVTQQAPTPEVLAAAAAHGVRCIVRTAAGFEVRTDQSSSRSSRTTG